MTSREMGQHAPKRCRSDGNLLDETFFGEGFEDRHGRHAECGLPDFVAGTLGLRPPLCDHENLADAHDFRGHVVVP